MSAQHTPGSGAQRQDVYANGSAEEMLGWSRGTLAGQRLVAIIPERLHEAHIAGYTRYLVRQQPRILGERIHVPARRRDNTELEVELRLDVVRSSEGRLMFVGTLLPNDGAGTAEHPAHVEDVLGSLVQLLAAPVDEVKQPLEQPVVPILETLAASTAWQVGAWRTIAGDRLQCLATWSDGTGRFDRFTSATMTQAMQRGVGLPGRVWAAGQPVWLANVVASANFPRAAVALDAGLRTGCAFPVFSDGELAAVVELFMTTALQPQPAVIGALEKAGQLLGLSLHG